jgi:hypothetical protein
MKQTLNLGNNKCFGSFVFRFSQKKNQKTRFTFIFLVICSFASSLRQEALGEYSERILHGYVQKESHTSRADKDSQKVVNQPNNCHLRHLNTRISCTHNTVHTKTKQILNKTHSLACGMTG